MVLTTFLNQKKKKMSFPKVHVMRETNQTLGLQTIIRNKNCSRDDFIFYSNRLIRLLLEEALSFLPYNTIVVTTNTDSEYIGSQWACKVCGVSIIRAGESMENGLSSICKDIRIGKILIQRDESTAEPKLYYTKFPFDIAERYVILMDPMLATGGSAITAIKVLIDKGVSEEHIIFANLIAVPEGIQNLSLKFPKVQIVTTCIDEKLNDSKFIIPGIGDFGDRYFGTD